MESYKSSALDSKTNTIKKAALSILRGNTAAAEEIVNLEYPFVPLVVQNRSYTVDQKMKQFIKDGFIDRYTGEHLLNPGILRILSVYFPKSFPYHAHWKMTNSHLAYWELTPTIDHVIPIAQGGLDVEDNWVTTSMMNNSIKSNWTIEQLQWKLHERGSIAEWDGLTKEFIEIVNRDSALLNVKYIKQWYLVSVKYIGKE